LGGWAAGGVAAATAEERVAIYLNLPFNLSRCLVLNFFSFLGTRERPAILTIFAFVATKIN